MFKGSIVAIVTPFKNGKVDQKALGDLIEWHIKEGTNAIVPCGTTGESATLDYNEHHRVIRFTVEAVNKRVPVIAGTGANATKSRALMGRFLYHPITTSRPRKGFTGIMKLLQKQ
jgi:4-hydroxy-tetrahydrodipicolinate synthase